VSTAAGPTISVVINTFNRAPSLRQTLDALRRQVYDRFEVVVVNGPSADDTEALLAEFAADLRAARCPEVNLSRSRNVGIAAASGEVVAFLDDDAIPDPYWLTELAAGYDSDRVSGVGGVVYDYTGYTFQFAASVTDRVGNARYDVPPPYWGYLLPGGEQFLHLQGTNASFRRRCLQEIGGFDEEIEYFLDETEVCLQLVERGHQLRLLDCAAVYHKFLPSHLRNEWKVYRKPFPVIKNKCYFALRARLPSTPLEDVLARCQQFADQVVRDARNYHFWGALTAEELAAFEDDVDRGLWLGIARGLNGARKSGRIPPPRPEAFRPYPRLAAPPRRWNLCFVCPAAPTEGGAGRATWARARAAAARGHEAHFLTRSPDHNRVDFEDGVWVHRLAPEKAGAWDDLGLAPAVRAELGHAAAAHKEVRRIRGWRRVDLVEAALPGADGLFCLQDDDLTCVATLHAAPPDVAPGPAELAQRFCLEGLALRSARRLLSVGDGPLAVLRRHGRRGDAAAVLPEDDLEGQALRAYEELLGRGLI
jgi:glycosyltransferase involved in cell wall biosynthesis